MLLPVPVLLALLLQTSWPTLPPLALLAISTVVGLLVAFFWKRYDAKVAADKAKQEAENVWRKARLDAEQGLRDALKQETAARTQWQLENDGDLERIAGILKDVNETQKLTAALAATSQHHGGELLRIDRRIEEVSRQLTQFVMDHAKHS